MGLFGSCPSGWLREALVKKLDFIPSPHNFNLDATIFVIRNLLVKQIYFIQEKIKLVFNACSPYNGHILGYSDHWSTASVFMGNITFFVLTTFGFISTAVYCKKGEHGKLLARKQKPSNSWQPS